MWPDRTMASRKMELDTSDLAPGAHYLSVTLAHLPAWDLPGGKSLKGLEARTDWRRSTGRPGVSCQRSHYRFRPRLQPMAKGLLVKAGTIRELAAGVRPAPSSSPNYLGEASVGQS